MSRSAIARTVPRVRFLLRSLRRPLNEGGQQSVQLQSAAWSRVAMTTTEPKRWEERRLQGPTVSSPAKAALRASARRHCREIKLRHLRKKAAARTSDSAAICCARSQIHYQHQFKDQFPETRKKSMQLHAKRSYDYEYLKPGTKPEPFDFSKLEARTEHGSAIHSVVDAVSSDPPQPDMRMVLVDG